MPRSTLILQACKHASRIMHWREAKGMLLLGSIYGAPARTSTTASEQLCELEGHPTHLYGGGCACTHQHTPLRKDCLLAGF